MYLFSLALSWTTARLEDIGSLSNTHDAIPVAFAAVCNFNLRIDTANF